MGPYIFTSNGMDDIVGWSSQQLCDNRKLIDMVFSWEKGFALQHFCKDAACAPYINLDVVLLPGEHNLGSTVVSRRDIASHLRVLDAGETEVTDLQIAVLVDQDIRGLQVPMNDSSRMDIFQSSLEHNLDDS